MILGTRPALETTPTPPLRDWRAVRDLRALELETAADLACSAASLAALEARLRAMAAALRAGA